MSDKETEGVGTPDPETDRDPPETDAELEGAGDSDSGGSSGAEEGLSPWSPEAYDPDAEGPTTSTEGS